jgi:glutamyl-tRNA(Gln) amidotransferase subunit E
MFERVLPGADRMYPDTDSAPIPISNEYIEEIQKRLPAKVIERYHQLNKWGIPKDTYTYIFKKNLFPLIERIISELKIKPKYTGTFFGHYMKYIEGQLGSHDNFEYEKVYGLLKFIKKRKLDLEIAKQMLPVIYEHPNLEFESVLTIINYKKIPEEEIISRIAFLLEKFEQSNNSKSNDAKNRWVMGQLRKIAVGNINLKNLSKQIVLNDKNR